MVFHQLLQFANGQHMVYPKLRDTSAHPGNRRFVCPILQVHQAHPQRNPIANRQCFAYQRRGWQQAADEGHIVPQGFVERLVLPLHHCFRLRGGYAAPHIPADVKA